MAVRELNDLVRRYAAIAEDEVREAELGQIADRAAMTASNVAHQLRSTLDNLVWELTRLSSGTQLTESQQRQVAFPIETSKEKGRDRFMRALKGVDDLHRDVIEAIQPWHDLHPEAAILARLKSSWNDDKHRVLKVLRPQGERQPPPQSFPGISEADWPMAYGLYYEDGSNAVDFLRRALAATSLLVSGFAPAFEGKDPELDFLEDSIEARALAYRFADPAGTHKEDLDFIVAHAEALRQEPPVLLASQLRALMLTARAILDSDILAPHYYEVLRHVETAASRQLVDLIAARSPDDRSPIFG